MTKLDNKVLACVDSSAYAEHVADYAIWAAARIQAPLEFLHVIDRHPELDRVNDRSGALTANAEERLLKDLSEEDAARSKAEREHGRIFLNGLRERALAAGAHDVDSRQRHGDLEETLGEQQDSVRLFVLGRRGASADRSQRQLGRHVEWTIRSLQCPILTVTDRFKTPERVMMAFDGSSITRKGVEMIAASPLFQALPIHLQMAGKASAAGPRQLQWARQTLEAAGFRVSADITPGDPESVIGRAVADQGIDLLVMGAYTHSPLHRLLLGSKTTDLLRSSRVPTLLLR